MDDSILCGLATNAKREHSPRCDTYRAVISGFSSRGGKYTLRTASNEEQPTTSLAALTKRPLPNHDGSELSFHAGNGLLLIAGVSVKADSGVRIAPRLVNMRIEGTLRASVHESLAKEKKKVRAS
jgi:hypothetical protein